MPTYEITDAQGRTLEFSGDTPPTEDVIAQAFAQAFPQEQQQQPMMPERRPESLAGARKRQAQGQGFQYPTYGEVGRELLGATQETLGTLGSLGGAAVGSFLGPAGAILGGATAGALATQAGGYLEAAFLGEEADADKILNDSLVSFGLDVAVPFVGSKIPALKQLISRLRKQGAPDEVIQAEVNRAIKQDIIPNAGSPESLQQTQQVLQRELSVLPEGQATTQATLLPTQAGADTPMARLATRLGGFSMFGSGNIRKNMENINTVIQEEMTELLNQYSKQGLGSQVSSDAIGEAFNDVILAGKKGLSDKYDEGLAALRPELSGAVSTKSVLSSLKTQLKRGQRAEGAFSEYNKQTLDVLEEYISILEKAPTMKMADLIDLEKKLGRDIDQIGNFRSQGYNGVAERELVGVRKSMQNAINLALSTKNPTLAARYRDLNSWYSEARGSILPDITSSLFERAGRNEFTAVGQVLTTTGNISKIKAMLSQIDAAYKQIPPARRAELDLQSPEEAKKAIREGYLNSLFSDIGSESFDITKSTFRNLAAKAQKGNEAERLQAIFGEDYGVVKRLFNAMADVSVKEESLLGSIFLRAQEYGAARGVLTGGVGGVGSFGVATGTVSAPAALGTAGVVLGIPYVMSKWATNPKVVSHILKLDKEAAALARQGKLDRQQMLRLSNGLVEYIMNESDDPELASLVGQAMTRQDYMERTADARSAFEERKARYEAAKAYGRM